ncbi:hypothetical protein M413DRAFT_31317 [Hebeloma cylindrosporum]|uniref:Uncharacterized protein n=1 Tax=Hebeloma cylindrosporum TaxID=76867 RepID=A0A0C2XG81_HEBCY|nr:hypothetical protein M413DRAFT_31317 [Hebeloma cylindrosporum h7]
MTCNGLLSYSASRVGNPLPRTSSEPLQPGDYASYTDSGQPESLPQGLIIRSPGGYGNFLQWQTSYEEEMATGSVEDKEFFIDFLRQNEISDELAEEIKDENSGVCFFTGRTPNASRVCWLVPPLLARWCKEDVNEVLPPAEIDAMEEHFRGKSNLIVIVKSFIHPSWKINLELMSRIVIFRDLGLPSHLKPGQSLPAASSQKDRVKFLKGNFKFCLGHHFLGGAIEDDHPDVGEYMDIVVEHGLQALVGMTSPIAQEILELYEEDSEEEEDDEEDSEEEDDDEEDSEEEEDDEEESEEEEEEEGEENENDL